MKKRGLSDVIISILLLLIAIIAVIIIWQVVKILLKPDIDATQLGIDLEIKSAIKTEEVVKVVVERKAIVKTGKGELIGIAFKFFSSQESYVENKYVSINELEIQPFNFDLSGKLDNPIKVSIAPIVRTEKGKNITANIVDSYQLEQGNFACTPVNNPCSGKQCGQINNGTCGLVTCPNTCTPQQTCINNQCVNPTSPIVNIQMLIPSSNIEVNKFSKFNFTLNVSCSNANCGNMDVSLDPEEQEKIGLISTIIDTTPFYTYQNNPAQISLNKDSSQLVVFWVNATGNSGLYKNFFAYANLTFTPSISASTKKINVTIKNSCEEISNSEAGLVALYHMNNNWEDATANNNDGAAYGGATFITESKLGSHAGLFNGNGYISIADSPSLNPVNAITISMWITTTSMNTQKLIYKYAGGDAWVIGINSGDNGIRVWFSGTEIWANYPSLANNNWHHIAITYDKSSLILYIDGINKAETSYSSDIQTNGDVDLGRHSLGGGENFNGRLDELAVYNRALSSSEIQNLYTKQNC